MKMFILLLSVCLLMSGCTNYSSPNTLSNSSPNTDHNDDYRYSQLTLTPSTLPDAEVGKPYDVKISAGDKKGSIYEMSIQSEPLPKGMEIRQIKEMQDDAVAEISGTPVQRGAAKFTIKISRFGTQTAGQRLEQEFQLIVK